MQAVLSALRKLGYNAVNCLDDIFICGDTFAACRDAVNTKTNSAIKNLNTLCFTLILLKWKYHWHKQKMDLTTWLLKCQKVLS